MASPGLEPEGTPHHPQHQHHESSPEPAFREAQKWIEAVTGRRFGDKDFRSSLENGILLCELLSSIKPGLVKKINRLPTPIAGLDNLTLFLRGCEELGLKGSQLFDPGDLQDTSVRANPKVSECSRKLKNVLITIYWLGKAANSCTTYNGPTLDLKEFEGLLSQMRKEAEDSESPKRSVRDSGYIDCWDSERSDSLSPPRHGRDDSFDSLDSFGSRSQQTPSPDVVIRGSSDGRGSDSESDAPQRKLPDVRKDDMLARRTSYNEPRSVMPFNQYLPNKSNQSTYVPTPLRRKKAEREDGHKSWSTATSPIGGERPFSEALKVPVCQACLEKGSQPPAILAETAAKDDLASRRARANQRPPGNRQRFVHFGPVTEIDQQCWQKLSIARPGEEDEGEGLGAKPGNEAATLRRLLSAAPVATPAIGLSSQVTERASALSGDEAAQPLTPAELAQRENKALDEKLAQYREQEEEEDTDREERVPDLEKDDMLARRTGVFQKQTGGTTFNKFLPLPGSKLQTRKDIVPVSLEARRDATGGVVNKKEHPYRELSPTCSKTRKEPSATRAEFWLQEPQAKASGIVLPNHDTKVIDRANVRSENEDEENDADELLPDLEKDDMHARRTGVFQKAAGPTFNSFLPMPGSVKYKATPVAVPGSTFSRPVEHREVSATESSSTSISHSTEVYRTPNTSVMVTSHLERTPKGIPRSSPKVTNKEEVDRGRTPASPSLDIEKDDTWFYCTLPSVEPITLRPMHFPLMPATHQGGTGQAETKGDTPQRRPSWLDDDLPPILSHRATNVSDDPESVSMTDMRYEEEAMLQPHSQTRHELMHNQYNKMQEEENHWQDDLARWKSRRRSASQDLIKKEEERKMMEKLMSGDGSQSHRRKSIKTYKEIVEEKERREQELHEAYRNARTPEEAATILQRYALRFTISEAVLERLQLPRQPECSLVVNPSASSTSLQLHSTALLSAGQDPGLMKYLRQQSAPVPKFTSTMETMVGRVPDNQTQMQAVTPDPVPTHTVLPKTVPLLTPKPYSQPRSSQAGLKSVMADGMARVNGETGLSSGSVGDTVDQGRTGGASPGRTVAFTPPSPVQTPNRPMKEPQELGGSDEPKEAHQNPSVDHLPTNKTPETGHQKSTRAATPPVPTVPNPAPVRPTSLPTSGLCTEIEVSTVAAQEGQDEGKKQPVEQPPLAEDEQDKQAEDEVSSMQVDQSSMAVTATEPLPEMAQSLKILDMSISTELSSSASDSMQRGSDDELSILSAPGRAEALTTSPQVSCESSGTELAYSADNARLRWEFFALPVVLSPSLSLCAVRLYLCVSVFALGGWPCQIPSPMLGLVKRVDYWSWDPEEERKRQERWQQEQERMLQEKYQREQEKLKQEWEKAQKEVEEEERRYHEEEKRILEETVAPLTPRSSALPSPIRVDPLTPSKPQDTIVQSLADWERKQELLEEQARRVEDSGHNLRTGHMAVGSTECLPTTESSSSHGSSETEAIAQTLQNGQRAPVDQTLTTTPQLQLVQEAPQNSKLAQNKQPQQEEVWNKTASLDRNCSSQQPQSGRMKRSGSCENVGTKPFQSSTFSPAIQPQSPNRSVSGKKLCSSCANPLGKGAAMIIETLGLYFHIQCFKCGICKGQLGDTSTGTDVRIRNGLLNCHDCYIKSRAAGQPTTL
ncbi:LIM and calponin homology domains-containing protein 1 [Arapaima gigas]